MANHLINKLRESLNPKKDKKSYLRNLIGGSIYRRDNFNANSSIADIRSKIEMMRALSTDSQMSTALSYYATDATTPNSSGQIIWASSEDEDLADIINQMFKRWNINAYARDHILELATMGNLYIPTTDFYRDLGTTTGHIGVALDNNTIPNDDYDIIPSYKIPPEDIVHIWLRGKPEGFLYQPDTDHSITSEYNTIKYPESSIIHFSLGGLLGDYRIAATLSDGSVETYDISFAEPLMTNAVTPTQTLNLLEDAYLLASLVRVIRFVNVDCSGAEEEEIQDILQQVKDAIEQQMSINTNTGDAQSFVNPQSPNNLIYMPKVNGSDAVSITDLNMASFTEADNNLLDFYQNKKLSVIGVPKEAMNFSSSEGLGGAGNVMTQRSALYSNALERIMTAYKTGWTDAINKYFIARNMSGYVDKFELHMSPIITQMSTIQFDKRDATLNQATTLIQLLQSVGVKDPKQYSEALIEILSETFPKTSANIPGWNMTTDETTETGGLGRGF